MLGGMTVKVAACQVPEIRGCVEDAARLRAGSTWLLHAWTMWGFSLHRLGAAGPSTAPPAFLDPGSGGTLSTAIPQEVGAK